MTYDELLSEQHAGRICDLDLGRGIGFIRSERIHELTGQDVRFRTGQLGADRPEIGDVLSFAVALDAQGRPWLCPGAGEERVEGAAPPLPAEARARSARGLRGGRGAGRGLGGGTQRSGRPGQMFTVERLLTEEHGGIIANQSRDAGYGFIRNDAIHMLCGRDVRFETWQCPGSKVGDEVTFRVALTADGKPRVAVVEQVPRLQAAHGENCAMEEDVLLKCADLQGKVLKGIVSEVDASRGFGRVACQEVRRACLADVFLPRRFLGELAVGDHVRFRVELAAGPGGGALRTACQPCPRAVEVQLLPREAVSDCQ